MDLLNNKKPKESSKDELTVERLKAHDDAMKVVEDGTPPASGSGIPSAPGSGTPSVAGSETPSEVESERSARQLSLANHLKRLGDKITEMMDYAMPRNNVHKPIKDGLTKARLILQSCCTALDGLEHLPRQNTVEKEVQTSPGMKKTSKTNQTTTPKSSNIPQPSAKRNKRGGEKDAAKDPKSESSGTADWQRVQRKRRGKKVTPAKTKAPDPKAKVKPAGRPRTGVVVVKAKDPKSYAEILKLLRSEPTLQDSVSSVNKVRRSAGGELLLQLDKACTSPDELGRKLDSAMGELGSATARTPVTAIEIKDLDEVTTKEEICGALRTHLDGATELGVEAVRSLRKAFAGTQTAVVTLPDQLAAKAIKLGHIRVGWVNCRIRERNEVRRCYRCWEPGHMAVRCQGPDRRSCCHRCGREGHMAKTCQNVPSCLLCRGDDARTHASLSAACPLAKKFARGT